MTQLDPAAEEPQLRSLTGTPPLPEYVRDLWDRREFTMSLATGSLRSEHLDTTLGNLWHVLNPALLMGVYFLIFGVLLETSRGVTNFVGFLAIGVFTYTFSYRTVSACGSSIANNIGLLRSLQFPRAVLPISTVVRELTGYGFAATVMMGAVVVTGELPRLSWVLVPVLVVLLTMFNAGLGLIVARLTDRVRDVANVLPFVFRILFYLSGIIFSVTSFVDDDAVVRLGIPLDAETVRQLFVLDPYFTYIELLRHTLMGSYTAEFPVLAWTAAIIMAPVTFAFGLSYFRAGEKTYGRG